jgi:tRNA 2-thiouridine synthesizing protein A
MAMGIHHTLDLQGQPSARAVERAARALNELSCGELIEVLASDPGAVSAFAGWSRSTGNALLESSQLGNVFRFVIRKN